MEVIIEILVSVLIRGFFWYLGTLVRYFYFILINKKRPFNEFVNDKRKNKSDSFDTDAYISILIGIILSIFIIGGIYLLFIGVKSFF